MTRRMHVYVALFSKLFTAFLLDFKRLKPHKRAFPAPSKEITFRKCCFDAT